jgi:hypothetical protein
METKTKYEVAKDQKTGDTIIFKYRRQVVNEVLFPALAEMYKHKKYGFRVYNLAGQLMKGG